MTVRVADQPAAELTAELVGRGPPTRHFRLAVERLYKWAHQVRAVPANPIGRLEKPPPGQRDRIATRAETARILAASSRAYRRFLAVQRHTLTRPWELRQLRWADVDERGRVLRLRDFKAKKRRKDRLRVRYVALDGFAARLLAAVRRNRNPLPADLVFPNRYGAELTCQAVRLAMHRACERAGIDQRGERVVCYTMRHTGATAATRAGVRDRVLADLMGHTSTRTTARYQHLDHTDMIEAIDRANARRREPPAGPGAIAGRVG
jgi:integrase